MRSFSLKILERAGARVIVGIVCVAKVDFEVEVFELFCYDFYIEFGTVFWAKAGRRALSGLLHSFRDF